MLLSLVIPTKNRYKTLLPLVDTVLAFESSDIEIVIQDNSIDNSEFLEFLATKTRSELANFRYNYTPGTLSVIENSDLAVKNSSGEYVCFIGDDDGVMPYIVEVVKWMKKSNIDSVKGYKPNYYWPNQRSGVDSKDVSGNLKFRLFTYSFNKKNCREAIFSTLHKGGTSLHFLPCLYHGIVNKSILDKIYSRCSTYFPGPSPDMANAVALALELKEYAILDIPVVISGKSVSSTGGKGVLHQHIAKVEDVSHLPASTSQNWSSKIPKYWTGQTIWAESVIKAAENCGKSEILEEFDFEYLYASLFVFHYKHRDAIFKGFKFDKYSLNFLRHCAQILASRIKIYYNNRRPSENKVQRNNVPDIKSAIEILDSFIDKGKLSVLLKNR